MLAAALYRTRQFFAALSARTGRADLDPAPARPVLSPQLFALFERMPPEDRRHGLDVLGRLQAEHDLAAESDAPLLEAALLHDVGKAEAGVGLPHRIARVVLRPTVPWLWRWLSGWPTGWRRPFWAVAHHPERGAIWVETEGGDTALVELIRFHEAPAPARWSGLDLERWHAALTAADASC